MYTDGVYLICRIYPVEHIWRLFQIQKIGDQINKKHSSRNIFILTPERARELFNNKDWINLEFVLLDEAQLSEDKGVRGLYFDSIVRRLKKHFPSTKILFAHPFISNPEALYSKVVEVVE